VLLGQVLRLGAVSQLRLLADIKAGKLPPPVIDSGVDVVTAANVDQYRAVEELGKSRERDDHEENVTTMPMAMAIAVVAATGFARAGTGARGRRSTAGSVWLDGLDLGRAAIRRPRPAWTGRRRPDAVARRHRARRAAAGERGSRDRLNGRGRAVQ
jgi:hypothetical protein